LNKIEEFYDNNTSMEWDRLDNHPLEFEITKKILDLYISPNSKIADIGGGSGKYSFYLKQKNHTINLVDISSKNIELAKLKSNELGINLDNYIHGNSCDLSFFDDNSFDVVLCMGPLYHIFQKADRDKTIHECLRILKPNGIIIFSFISKFSLPFMVFELFPERIKEYQKYFETVANTGEMIGKLNNGFDAYLFYPEEILEYLSNFNIKMKELSGAEGLFAQQEKKIKELTRDLQEEWITYSFNNRSNPSILGSNNHLLYIGHKV
jgi:S-adenosylmethionine-dependent methyltransferase